jgi:hypothetical protein
MIEAAFDVAFEYPLCTVVFTERDEARFDSVCCGATSPEPVGVWVRCRFCYRVESL